MSHSHQQKQFQIFNSLFIFFAILSFVSASLELVAAGSVATWLSPIWFILGAIITGIVAQHNKQ